MNAKKHSNLSKNFLQILLFNSLFVISTYAETTPIIQVGADMILMKKPSSTIEVNHGYAIEGGVEYADEDFGNFTTQFLLGYRKVSLTRILKKKKKCPYKSN